MCDISISNTAQFPLEIYYIENWITVKLAVIQALNEWNMSSSHLLSGAWNAYMAFIGLKCIFLRIYNDSFMKLWTNMEGLATMISGGPRMVDGR